MSKGANKSIILGITGGVAAYKAAEQDRIVMARGLDPEVAFERTQLPAVFTSPTSGHALLILADVREEFRVLIAPLADVVAGKARWQPVAEFADEVTGLDLHGDELYLLSTRGHPRGRVLKIPALASDLSKAVEVVPESALVLQAMARGSDGLYVQAMDGGLGRLQRLGNDSKLVDIALPFDGMLTALAADPTAPGAVMLLSGWLTGHGRRGRRRSSRQRRQSERQHLARLRLEGDRGRRDLQGRLS